MTERTDTRQYFVPGTIAEYEALMMCYSSGQISESQWQEHLKDARFRAYVQDGRVPLNTRRLRLID